jgi:SAM-dependent methyltransferase
MGVFRGYADFYDVYYADKNYAQEVDFVLELASRFGSKPKSLLDMGCGTGRHLAEFYKRGLRCDGFDRSPEMLAQAAKRLSGQGVNLSEGNLINFENRKRYELVISMFAVIGYLTDNNQLIGGLSTARKHLRTKGLFIFDGWFGPAVLAQQPEKRCHRYQNGQDIIIRKATPSLDPAKQTTTVHYEVTLSRNGHVVRQIEETHTMRFMFVQEMAMAMQAAGLELIHCCPFLKPDGELTTKSWNVSFVARKK